MNFQTLIIFYVFKNSPYCRMFNILNIFCIFCYRIHDEKRGFTSQDDAIDLLVANGADREVAVATLANEETMKTALDANFKLLSKYKIAGVPTMLVNHKYQFDVTKAGGYEKVFEVVEETLKLPSNCK